jgi:methylglyoxal synthase
MKRIALVAHDQMKPLLLRWVIDHRDTLTQHEFWATGTTGRIISEHCPEMKITSLFSGPLGGDAQIGNLIVEGKLDILIFFTDPLTSQPHDVDVKALSRLASVYNVPMACNLATADFLVSSPYFNEPYTPHKLDFSSYINRKV